MTPPRATYRLQLHPGFDFDAAAGVADYLADLGVSHVYLSPVLQAALGSTHGYDVVDPSRVSADLGGEAGHARLVAALRAARLGTVLDIVPNHMAIGGPENRWWWDVLEHGPSSPWAGHFDVTWDPPEERLRNTILLPILGDHYGRVLDRGEVTLARDGGAVVVRYFDHVLPTSPRSLAAPLRAAAGAAGDDDLAFAADAYGRLRRPAARDDPAGAAERHRDAAALRRLVTRILAERPATAEAVDRVLAAITGDVDALDAFLEEQNYRIAYWRSAGRDLGYRRFFDIDTLVGLRVEDPDVFADAHELILRWVRDGVVDGLRVDHPDGLRDPEQYLDRLARATGGVWTVAEKILVPGEKLPTGWPVAGTTGYDRRALIDGLFLDPAGEGPLTDGYVALTGDAANPAAVVAEARDFAVRSLLAADVARLTALLVEVCEGRRHQRDRTRHELHEAMMALVAAFPVYRTYVRAEAGLVRREDEERVAAALAAVGDRIDPDLAAFLADLLLLRLPDRRPLEDEWVMQFQQVTGPAMAKGVEDTAFYRFTRLLAQNEVGGDLARFGVGPDEFHAANVQIQDQWPATMTTLSTHDTKRSADVRARLALLSERPAGWADACGRWMAWTADLWPGGDPDRHAQHLLFQTLVGAWPLPADRARDYLAKATREAKLATSWTEPDEGYEAVRDAYVEAVLADPGVVGEIAAFAGELVGPGRTTALAQTLLALTVPGVPDTYQGGELWDLSLVDPDNRRPVDFGRRRALLAELAAGLGPDEILARADEGLPKLAVVRAALALRAQRPAAFGEGPAGAYAPLAVDGPAAARGVAFARGGEAAVVVPRLVLGLADRGWEGTTVALPAGRWRDVITGEPAWGGAVAVADLLARFPVALLERAG